MAVLLLAEVNDGELALDATAKTVAAAAKLGEVTALCCGATCSAAAEAAAKIDGVAKVLCAEHAVYGHRLAEATAALMKRIPANPSSTVGTSVASAAGARPSRLAVINSAASTYRLANASR